MVLCRGLFLDFMFVLPQAGLPSVQEEVAGLREIETDERQNCWGNQWDIEESPDGAETVSGSGAV